MVVPDAGEERFTYDDLNKGDTVQASFVSGDREVRSNTVTIENSPPQITAAKLLPESFKPGDMLNVAVTTSDPDGDEVTLSYAWTLNGEPAGSGPRIEQPVRRGDHFSVTITPYDGTDYGNPVVIDRDIRNMPPVIEDSRNYTFQNSVYSYQVRATDPDGDRLVYSLEAAPQGMTINPATGLVTWPVPGDFRGEKSATIKVDDGNGGTATYEIRVTIQ